MILCDVNVLLYAMVEGSAHHEICLEELERLRREAPDMALSELVLAALVRIASNPKVFRPAVPVDEVFEFVEALRSTPGARPVEPGPRHWRTYRDLVRASGVRGPDTTDAYLAALALTNGCEWWTTDAGFARFPGLRWRNLIA